MTAQLELFEPATSPVTFVTVCPRCSKPVAAHRIDDAGQPWGEAALWSYVAQRQHEQEAHT